MLPLFGAIALVHIKAPREPSAIMADTIISSAQLLIRVAPKKITSQCPEDSTIHFAACFGDIDNIKQATNGEFLCKPPRIATDDTKTFISTASAPTKAEACKKAKAMAANDKGSGECTCQTRGKISICRVESTGPKPASSVIDSAKKEIRERAKCKSDDKDCIPANKIHNAGPGVNG